MLIKRSWLLIGIVSAILVSALAFSGCTQQESEIGDDYLLFELSGIDNEYLHISKNGYVEHTSYDPAYDDEKILAHNSGTLSEVDMEELSEFIENSGFFKLRGDFFHHYDYFRISVCREGKVKTVYNDYIGRILEPFEDVVDYLWKKVIPKLHNDPRYGTFIMAERKKGSTSENVLSEKDLKEHPFLEQAIHNPGWFIYVGTRDNAGLEDYFSESRNHFFLNFEGNKFYIEVYERKK